jgi:hypothetical protein
MSTPRKPTKKSKSVKLVVNSKRDWRRLLKDIDKKEIPIKVIRFIEVSLLDGSKIELNVQEMLATGQDADQLERDLNDKFEELDAVISNIDFYIDIDKVAETVQIGTDQVLKNL